VLVVIADEEAINQALSPFACQHRVYVVANQRAAQQHGVPGRQLKFDEA
jgi:hypothetical protein